MNIRDAVYNKMQQDKPAFNPIFDRTNFLSDLKVSLQYAAETLLFINQLQEEDTPKYLKVVSVKYELPNDEAVATVEESKMRVVVIKLDLCAKGEKTAGLVRQEKEIRLNVPYIGSNGIMRINDISYIPIFQMIDRGIYRVGDSLLLKSLLMPISLKPVKSKTSGLQTINVSLLRKSFNPLSVLPVDTYQEALDFYGVDEDMWYIQESPEEDSEGYYVFPITKKKSLCLDEDIPEHVAVVVADYIIGNKLYLKDNNDDTVQSAILTKLFKTKKAQMAISLERCIDSSTRANLVHIAEEDKKSVHHVIRYMLWFFKKNLDGLHLVNKRVRLAEVCALPLVQAFSEASYRLLNSSNALTLNRISRTLNVQSQDFLVSKMISSGLVRQISSTSSIQFFDFAKFTLSGNQGIASIPVRSRQQHPSMLGQIGLHSTSVSDPGASGFFTPYNTLTENGFFDESVDLVTPFAQSE